MSQKKRPSDGFHAPSVGWEAEPADLGIAPMVGNAPGGDDGGHEYQISPNSAAELVEAARASMRPPDGREATPQCPTPSHHWRRHCRCSARPAISWLPTPRRGSSRGVVAVPRTPAHGRPWKDSRASKRCASWDTSRCRSCVRPLCSHLSGGANHDYAHARPASQPRNRRSAPRQRALVVREPANSQSSASHDRFHRPSALVRPLFAAPRPKGRARRLNADEERGGSAPGDCCRAGVWRDERAAWCSAACGFAAVLGGTDTSSTASWRWAPIRCEATS